MAEFELNRLPEYTDQAIFAEIIRVAGLIPGKKLTRRDFDAISRVKSSSLHKRYGSWEKALALVGLSSRFGKLGVSKRCTLNESIAGLRTMI